MTDVRVENNQAKQQFETTIDGHQGVLTYTERDGKLYLLHTGVDDALEGQGVGSALVRTAAEHARTNGLRVVPFCSFAQGWLERHHEYADLVTGPD
ncbi:MAG TPA: GNAT family N-acetyltransferase [Longimicrobiaceae bacterium]|nr:GNAT family N-acetyltransferase [Longimicrobiaceae bacterium]